MLTGRITALNRFISRMSDCKSFFKLMKDETNRVRGKEQSEALKQLKSYLVHPFILFAPKFGEELYLYRVVSYISVSAVLLREKDGIQKPIFFISRTLSDPETRYSAAEKLVLALIHAKKKLRHYFESHCIIVVTTYPLKAILSKPDIIGRNSKTAMSLSTLTFNTSLELRKIGNPRRFPLRM